MSALSTPATTVGTRFDPQLARRKLAGTVFLGACVAAIGLLVLALVLLLYDVLTKGLPYIDLDFITGTPSRRPEQAGILPALVGSIEIGLMVGLVSFPLGVAAAIYLEEYAANTLFNRILGQRSAIDLTKVGEIGLRLLGMPPVAWRTFATASS